MALPPGQKPYPNPNFLKDALLTSDPLTFMPESSETSVSFKNLGKLPRSDAKSIMSTCLIPQRNLLLVLPRGSKEISIYNTRKTFKLIAVKGAESEPSTISYSKELDKILVGASNLQIWNPITFKVEAQSTRVSQKNEQVYTLTYLPSPGILVAKTAAAIYAYSRDLTVLTRFELPPNGCVRSSTAEIFSVSQDLLLAVCHFQQPRSLLLNIKKQTIKEFDQLYMPYTSCVEMTQEAPNKIFTCLTSLNRFPSVLPGQLSSFRLTQFTVDPETEELVISRVTKTDHCFSSLYRLGDQKHFLAEGYYPSNIAQVFLLSVEKDQVEILRVISGMMTNFLGRFNTFTMVDSVILHIKEETPYLYACNRKQKKDTKSEELHINSEEYDLA